MRRFLVLAMALAAALLASASAQAQQAGRAYRIGWLGTTEDVTPERHKVFTDRLSDLGFVEGKNLAITRKGSTVSRDAHAALARELVDSRPDVLLTAGTVNTRLLQSMTTTIPIVFLGASDPVASGFVKSLSHPGGNITGVSNQQCAIVAKLLELARELVPKAKHMVLISRGKPESNACSASIAALKSEDPSLLVFWLDVFQEEGPMAEVLRAVAKARPEIIVLFGSRQEALAKALNDGKARRVPIVSVSPDGAAVWMNFDFQESFRLSADLIARLMTGASPGDLPVALPSRYRMEVNLPLANAQGLHIPGSVLLRADRVVQ